jgi:hypothetical protein
MTIFGKRLSEYVAFSKPFLILILVVGIARLAMSLGGAPSSIAKWFSITVMIWIGVLYYSVRVFTSGFGSYKQLLPICFLHMATAQVVIVPAIILAIFTGTDNIYSAPEYYFGSDGKTWAHAAAHLFGGMTIGSLMSWLVGCVIMFVTKKFAVRDKDIKIGSRA